MSQSFNQFSQALFTTQDLQAPQNPFGSFFQTQFPNVTQTQQFGHLSTQSQHSEHDNDLFGDDKFDASDDVEMTESENIDDSIFEETSQELASDTQTSNIFSCHTPTFNQSSYHTQLPVSSQLISQAASTHSKLTVVYDVKESFDQKIPQSIVDLFGETKEHYSDWTFISILCGQLCSEKFPMGAYHNLKLALLMSLVTNCDSLLHIIVTGNEISNANAIMREIGELAERFLPVTNKTSDAIVIKRNETCEAGALVLASRGVSFIEYWQNLKPKIKTQLIREIETNTLLVQKAQKHLALESTVWAHWSYSKKIKKDISSLDQFLNVFGIPIIIDDNLYRDDIVYDLIDQLTESSAEKSKGFDIPKADMKAFIDVVKGQTVTFDPQAEEMLKKYYTATHAIRRNALTQKSIEALRKMSEAHAKLCLRSNVMRQDVLAAIRICERFIKTLFGTDAYSSPNETKVNEIEDIDAYQCKMFEWFSCFTHDILEKI